jgi:hypothetical protein
MQALGASAERQPSIDGRWRTIDTASDSVELAVPSPGTGRATALAVPNAMMVL